MKWGIPEVAGQPINQLISEAFSYFLPFIQLHSAGNFLLENLKRQKPSYTESEGYREKERN